MAHAKFDKDKPLVRKAHIPDSDRTPDRDDAAEAIAELWPAPLSEIAEESGYSRTHVQNTLDRYFYQPDGDVPERNGLRITIEVPRDVDHPPSFLQGFVRGYREAFEEQR